MTGRSEPGRPRRPAPRRVGPQRPAPVRLVPILAPILCPVLWGSLGRAGAQLELRVAELAPPASTGAFPSVTAGADGSLWVSWLEPRGRNRADLRAARLEGDGWSAPIPVAEGDDWFVNWADFPALAVDAGGGLAAHWLQLLGEGTYAYGIRLALSVDGGATWSEPVWLHEDRRPVEHGFASLVPIGSIESGGAGGFGALWLDARQGEEGAPRTALLYRTVARDGALGPEEVLDELVCDCCPTALVRTPAGELIAAYRDRSDFEIRDVSWVRRPKDGHGQGSSERGWSEPRPVHDDGWNMPGCPVNGPRVLATSPPTVVWYTAADESAGQVLLRRLDGDAPPVRLDAGLPEGRVGGAALADGGAVVTWMDHAGVEGPGAAWLARRVDAAGRPGPIVTLAPVSSERASGVLRAARDGDSVVVAWTEPGSPPRLRTARLVPRAGAPGDPGR